MELFAIVLALIALFIIIAIGYLARIYGILNGDRVHFISHILVNVALPAISITSLQIPENATTMNIVDHMLVVAVIYYIAAFIIGTLIFRFIPSTPKDKGVFQFMLVFPNTLFMGLPVASAVFGQSSLFYVILFNVPFYLLVFTLGVWMLNRGRSGKIDIKVLLSPGLVAAIVGLIFFFTKFTIPVPVETGLDIIGSATTPLAMLVVGAMLATLPLKQLAGDWRVYLTVAFRLLVFPIILFLILKPFISDKILVGVAVLLVGMPVAANSVLLCEEYDVDATLASQGVFISTVLCLITIPLLELLL